MAKIPTSSSKITACPECDSGNLHVSGSEVECISCGWKHTAKKVRTTKAKPIPRVASIEDCGPEGLEDLLPKQDSIAAQLAAVVTVAPKAKSDRAPRQAPSTSFVLTVKGAAFCPNPERARVTKNKNHDTWLVVKALFSDEKPVVTLAEIWAAIPTHKDFVGYAKRSGWLVAGTPAVQ